MTVEHDTPELPAMHPESVFTHALVGVDGTEAGFEACRQAGVLVEPEGPLDLVFAVETALAVHTGLSAPRIAAEMEREGADALTAAAEIVGRRASPRLISAMRFAVPLRIVTALRDSDADLPRIHLHTPFGEEIDERPVDALQKASADVDLLIVGSRGLHGARALGSVSERIAHRAGCSVLVVRGPELR
jgi:nucleotide-binding universal stress UspA family protein